MAAPAIDGSVNGTASGTNTKTLALTTSGPGVVMVAAGWELGSAARSITGVTSTSGLVFKRRKRRINTGQNNEVIETWWAPSAGALSAENITVTWDNNFDDAAVVMFGVSGVGSITQPFDRHGTLPASSITGSSPTVTFSTEDPDTLLIGISGTPNNLNPYSGAPSGWTNLAAPHTPAGTLAQTTTVDYKQVAAAQAGATYQPGHTSQGVVVVDAFTAKARTASPYTIEQTKSGVGPNQAPSGGSGLGFDNAPTVGNLVIAFAAFNATYSSLTVNTSFWTVGGVSFDSARSSIAQIILYRYVQSGDTAALAPFTTAGTSYWAWSLFEISGVSGTWSSDVIAQFGRRNSKNLNTATLPSITCPADGALCLTGGNQYNGASNPTISGNWGVDSAANNNAQYGSSGGAHVYADAGDDISGVWSFTTTDSPGGFGMVILAPAAPTRPFIASNYVRASSSNAAPNTDLELGRTPTVGNIMVAIYVGDRGGNALPAVNTGGGWTQFATLPTTGGNGMMLGAYRAVQVGDTSTLPKICSANGASFNLTEVFELGGVSSWASDFVDVEVGFASAGATIATTPIATDGPNQLGVIFYANYNQSADPVQSGATTFENVDKWTDGAANYGAWDLVEHLFPVSGTNSENTFNRPGDTGGYMSMVFGLMGGSSSGGGSGASSGAASSGSPLSSGEIPAAGERVTQAVRLAIGAFYPPARVTQVARLTLGQVAVPIRATQGVRLTVAEGRYPMRVTQVARLTVARAIPCVTHWQQLWTIRRRDGVVYRFTSLDQDFAVGDNVFKSCGSLMPSAAEESSSVGSVSSIELTGILADDSITEADLYGGKFDDAFVEVWLWPFQGTESPRRLAAGWIGAVQHGEQGWTGEVIGPGAKLDQQALVVPYAPSCRWTFGDSRCTKDLTALQTTGQVTGVGNRGFFVTDAPDPANGSQWANGRVIWQTGRNAGVTCEVKSVDFAEGTVELWALAPFLPELGDELVLQPGCDLSESTCKNVYNNLINFGGFAEVPGNDALAQTPLAKIDQ